MSESSPSGDPAGECPDHDPLDEIREAAGVVVVALKQLLEATERVIEDPAALEAVVATGKSVVGAFASGFTGERAEPAGGPKEAAPPA